MKKHAALFSILSTNAPLVEVTGDGPIADLPGGLRVVDGTVTIAPANLLARTVRRWRVDALPSERTSIVVTDSPWGAFVGVRRADANVVRPWSIESWPRLRKLLKQCAPALVALWHLYSDEPTAWRDVNDGASNQAHARGGDLVVVSFVDVRCRHA